MDVEMPLIAVTDNPSDIRNFGRYVQEEVLRKLLSRGNLDTFLESAEMLDDYNGIDYRTIVTTQPQLHRLLDLMVNREKPINRIASLAIGRHGGLHYLFQKHQNFLFEKVDPDVNNYWRSLIEFEIKRRDASRAWDTLKKALNGFPCKGNHRFPLEHSQAVPIVSSLYELMINKRQLPKIAAETLSLPERVKYKIKERTARRKSREYTLVGNAPGLEMARKFRELKDGVWKIDPTGQKILAIADYFSKKRR